MPIYEYRCQSCGKEFEEWQKFSDPPVEKCGDCGGKTCPFDLPIYVCPQRDRVVCD